MRTFSDFFESLGDLDWLAILVATLVVMLVVVVIFYGPVFGKKWAAASGQEYSMKFNPKTDIPGIILAFVFQIGVAYMVVADDIEHSLVTALLGTLLIGSVLYGQTLWLKRNKVAVFIDIAYFFFAIAVGGYVQGLMA
ncbi:MAG TPA: DUF1761 domain-containing protein [Acidimicrobiia bacterium]|nr:DUF1761 domain-containing protein [Acidimicrobiia bacterium]